MNRCVYCGKELKLTNEYFQCVDCQQNSVSQGKQEIYNQIDYHEKEIRRLKQLYKTRYGKDFTPLGAFIR